MANPSPVPINQNARARGALAAASARRADALIRRLQNNPPMRREDLDRIIVAAHEHPVLTDAAGVVA